MVAARPFDGVDALLENADRVWQALSEDDWLEAFASHPRIGVQTEAGARASRSANWSAEEQSGVTGASGETIEALADLNRRYDARFGFIYLVCATGRTAGEMRALLETRLHNDQATELRTAAEEQRRITAIRLLKLAGVEDDVGRAPEHSLGPS